MSRFPITVAAMFVALFLVSPSFPVRSQDVRGDAGIPLYVKSPKDRPPIPAFDPAIIGPNQTADDVLASIPEKDSVIVIRGTVDMEGKGYFSAYPVFRAGSLEEAMKACRKEYVMRPQYNAAGREGYAMFVIVKDTGTDPQCWSQFRNLETIGLSCDRIMVKTTKEGEAVAWDNPDSSYANSYDLRTFSLGPITDR